MTPFFSVIISVFNKEELISDTVHSVLNQTFEDFEVIIVNDGSTDNSLKVLESIKDSRISILNTKNNGASSARNTGIKNAKGNFIALLDGDDLWGKSYLNVMFEAIKKHPDYMVFSCALAQKYKHKVVEVPYSFEPKETYTILNFFKSSLKFSSIHSSSVIFHKMILDKTGYFDPAIVSGQDTDMWIRIGLHYNVVFVNMVMAYYRNVSKSLSNSTFDARKKPKFDKYYNYENKDPNVKRFIDIHRYALAIMCKLNHQKTAFKFYKSELDINNLELRQRILLYLPRTVLDILLWMKSLSGEKIYHKAM